MSERKPLTDEAGEVRELGAEDMARMRPLADLAPDLAAMLAGEPPGAPRSGGPRETLATRPISLRVDQDVLDAYKATGPGWQRRMREVLRKGAPSRRRSGTE